ncbi:MAG: alpha/beta fold hydrolase [Planctomycetota bacterium]
MRWIVIVLCTAALLPAAEFADVTIGPSSENCFTVFLAADSPRVIDLAGVTETGPAEGAILPGGSAWRVVTGDTGVAVGVETSGNFVAALTLVPPAPGRYAFQAGSNTAVAIHTGGAVKVDLTPTPVCPAAAEFELDLPAEGAAVYFTGTGRPGTTGIFLRAIDPRVTSRLRLVAGEDRALRLAIDGLHFSAGRRFLTAGDPLRLTVERLAGIPAVTADLTAAAVISTDDGREIFRSAPAPFRIAPDGAPRAGFTWTPEAATAYRVTGTVEFRLADRAVGRLRQSFYFPDAVDGRLDELERQIRAAETERGARIPLAGLKAEVARLLNSRPSRTERMGEAIMRIIEELPAVLEAARAGRDPLADARGYIERAYFSAVDDSYQPFRLYIPRTPLKALVPLFVYLHGYVPTYSKTEWVDEVPELSALMERHGAILAVPFGRSNTDFQDVGEDDVLRVIDETAALYPVDPDRVYCIGYSMGGSGMWTLLAHYPDRFAAGVSIGGRTDFYYWHGLDRAAVPAFKRHLIDDNTPIGMPGNLANSAFWIFHGTDDTLVQPGQSTRMQAVLKARGAASTFTPVKGLHWIAGTVFSEYDITGWALEKHREAFPKEVDFTTHTTKYGRAWWLEIVALEAWGAPARVQGRLADDGITITRSNVRRLRVAVPPQYTGPTVRITDNGATAEHPVPADRVLFIGPAPEGDGPRKTAAMPGPIKEGLCGPFTVVYGSTFAGASTVDAAAAFARDWEEFAKGRPPVIAAADLTEAVIRDRSIVYFGDPVDGSWLAGVLPDTPVRVTPDSYSVGTAAVPAAGRGLAVMYPNPKNPNRYLILFAGLRWGADLPINHKFDHVPDYIVFDDAREKDGSNRAVMAGFFDPDWRFNAPTCWQGAAASGGMSDR